MGRYRIYPEYQDAAVDWLGVVPSNWQTARLGQYFDERRERVSDRDFPPLSVTMRGVVPQLDTAAKTDAGDNRKKVCPGDFVINSRSDRKGSSGVSEIEGSVSLISIVLKPRDIEPPFVHHLLRSQPFQEEFYRYGKGIVADLWSTNYSEMKNILLPIPSIDEQRQIAAFLDHEAAKIDRLIAKQERLIELLKEKRQAVISHAVTKGLNPDAPMKDSGVEWLDKVPEHWVVVQTRRVLLDIEQGKSPECENRVAEINEWGVLKTGCVNWGRFREEEHKALPAEMVPAQQYEINAGDLLMSRASGSIEHIGSVAYVNQCRRRLLLSDKIFRLTSSPMILARYLGLVLGSRPSRTQIESSISGAEGLANNITKETIRSIRVPLPPLGEQDAILNSLDTKLAVIDKLAGKAEEAVKYGKEHRTALISAAVTGKIDVRGWQKPNTEPREAAEAASV
jgi:type I restriction enzyme S subunit